MTSYNFYKKNGYVVFKNLYPKKECKKYLKLLRECADSKFSVMLNVHREDFLLAQVFKKLTTKKNLPERVDTIKKILKYSKMFLNIFKKNT